MLTIIVLFFAALFAAAFLLGLLLFLVWSIISFIGAGIGLLTKRHRVNTDIYISGEPYERAS